MNLKQMETHFEWTVICGGLMGLLGLSGKHDHTLKPCSPIDSIFEHLWYNSNHFTKIVLSSMKAH